MSEKILEAKKSISKKALIFQSVLFLSLTFSLFAFTRLYAHRCYVLRKISVTILPENQIKTAKGESNWNVILTRDTQRNRLEVSSFGGVTIHFGL